MGHDAVGDVAERREGLLQSIERNDRELREAVHDLAEATGNKLDLSEYVRSHPLAWVTGAFCFGLWFGLRGRGAALGPSPIDLRRILR